MIYLLKSLENSFEELPFRIKVQLFLLPILLIFLFLNLLSNFESEDKNIVNLQIEKSLVMKKKLIDIIKDIEKYSLENQIQIDSIENKNKSININATAPFESQLKLINFLESYNGFSKIKKLTQSKNSLDIDISFEKFYIKKKNKLLVSKNENKSKNITYRVQAIIGKKAFINDKWLGLNDTIGSFILFEIKSAYVILKSSEKRLKLRLYKDEKL